jgi:hypothetical protein
MKKFKSPLHISRMRIIDKYDRETQIKMKNGIIENYLEVIESLSDSIRQFYNMNMTARFLLREQEVLKIWTDGLKNFLVEWENKYEK